MALTENDWSEAARKLGCSVAAIKAVAQVEAPKGGFLPSGEPTILFERHVFSRLTDRKYDAQYPGISNRKPGGYSGGPAEHLRLREAALLDRDAALKSASWGKFQIMGFNHAPAGFPILQNFINAMYKDESSQLGAFVNFLRHEGLAKHLKHLDWARFAEGYNGPNYRINAYDTKMADAYRKLA